jgi:hypothetical protein
MTAVEWLHEKLAKSELEDMQTNINLWFKQAKEIEKQKQDEFAIGFAEWSNENYFNLNSYDKKITLQKALEIYKKDYEKRKESRRQTESIYRRCGGCIANISSK